MPVVLDEYNNTKKRAIDLLEDSSLLSNKSDKLKEESAKTLMDELSIASRERRLAIERQEAEMVTFWKEKEASIMSKLNNK